MGRSNARVAINLKGRRGAVRSNFFSRAARLSARPQRRHVRAVAFQIARARDAAPSVMVESSGPPQALLRIHVASGRNIRVSVHPRLVPLAPPLPRMLPPGRPLPAPAPELTRPAPSVALFQTSTFRVSRLVAVVEVSDARFVTEPKSMTANPVWSQDAELALPSGAGASEVARVSVWDKRVGRMKLMGMAIFPLSALGNFARKEMELHLEGGKREGGSVRAAFELRDAVAAASSETCQASSPKTRAKTIRDARADDALDANETTRTRPRRRWTRTRRRRRWTRTRPRRRWTRTRPRRRWTRTRPRRPQPVRRRRRARRFDRHHGTFRVRVRVRGQVRRPVPRRRPGPGRLPARARRRTNPRPPRTRRAAHPTPPRRLRGRSSRRRSRCRRRRRVDARRTRRLTRRRRRRKRFDARWNRYARENARRARRSSVTPRRFARRRRRRRLGRRRTRAPRRTRRGDSRPNERGRCPMTRNASPGARRRPSPERGRRWRRPSARESPPSSSRRRRPSRRFDSRAPRMTRAKARKIAKNKRRRRRRVPVPVPVPIPVPVPAGRPPRGPARCLLGVVRRVDHRSRRPPARASRWRIRRCRGGRRPDSRRRRPGNVRRRETTTTRNCRRRRRIAP